MKRLILMRHAEAERSLDDDKQREITARGENEALASAIYLKDYKIDHILCSPTKRTKQTLAIVQKYAEIPDAKVQFCKEIYTNIAEDLAFLVGQNLSEVETMMIVGHNPSLLEFAISCAPNEDGPYHQKILLGLKPAEVIVIEFPDAKDWHDAISSKGFIKDIFIPS